MEARVIDKKFTKFYHKKMYVLWICDSGFYHLGFSENQMFCDVYVGKSQLEIIGN